MNTENKSEASGGERNILQSRKKKEGVTKRRGKNKKKREAVTKKGGSILRESGKNSEKRKVGLEPQKQGCQRRT